MWGSCYVVDFEKDECGNCFQKVLSRPCYERGVFAPFLCPPNIISESLDKFSTRKVIQNFWAQLAILGQIITFFGKFSTEIADRFSPNEVL